MTDIQVSATGVEADSSRLKPHGATLWKPVLVFMLFVLTISLTGYLVFQRYKDVIKSEKQSELGGIAEL